MGEMEEQGCVLKCRFDENEQHKPTKEEMLDWLRNKSGLSEEYFDKIVEMKYDADNIRGLHIVFDKSVNCFIAIRQIKNHFVFGELKKYEIKVTSPEGKFEVIRLVHNSIELLTRNDVIAALKDFGEIIEIWKVKWRDAVGEDTIPTGDVRIRILTKKEMPGTLYVRGIECTMVKLTYEMRHSQKVLQELWDNCKFGKAVDYTKKIFEIEDKEPGCSIMCKLNIERDEYYQPNQTDVYEWLVRLSGLSEAYRMKILMFKKISDQVYQILFDSTVNCLLAMKEMKNCAVYHSHDVFYNMEITCPKGKFTNVGIRIKNCKRILSRQDVEGILDMYGVIVEYHQKAYFDSNGILARVIRCKLFRTKELPEELKIKGVDVKVDIAECELGDLHEETLRYIWNIVNSDNQNLQAKINEIRIT